MTDGTLTIYSTPWCGYCTRLKRQLDREGVTYRDLDIEQDTEAAGYVAQVNGGNLTVPVVTLPDGTALTNPPLKTVLRGVTRAA